MQSYNPKSTKDSRQKLRNNPTQPEIILWNQLKAKQFHGLKFRRQHGILNYIVDFYCPTKKLVIEIDGDSHYQPETSAKEKKRNQEIRNLGNTVVHYTNQQITHNLDSVLQDLEYRLINQPPLPAGRQANPLLKKEGNNSSPLLRGSQRELDSITQTITLTKSGTHTYTLDQEGSELAIIGRFWLKGDEALDLNITIIHQAKNTQASTSLKAVVEGNAQANLRGSIIVQKNAQNTNSFLEERILLLSDKARATAIPNLEIEANEVKCSHAATVGRIPEEQLFYLESRGLPKAQATHLIAQGFLQIEG